MGPWPKYVIAKSHAQGRHSSEFIITILKIISNDIRSILFTSCRAGALNDNGLIDEIDDFHEDDLKSSLDISSYVEGKHSTDLFTQVFKNLFLERI